MSSNMSLANLKRHFLTFTTLMINMKDDKNYLWLHYLSYMESAKQVIVYT